MDYFRKKFKKVCDSQQCTYCHLRIKHESDASLHSKSEKQKLMKENLKKSEFLRNS